MNHSYRTCFRRYSFITRQKNTLIIRIQKYGSTWTMQKFQSQWLRIKETWFKTLSTNSRWVPVSPTNKLKLIKSKCKEMRILLLLRSMLSSLVLWNYHQREGNRWDVQCQATWPEHFNRSEMNLSHVRKFQQGLGMALLPKATKEGEHRNQGNHKLFLNTRPSCHRVCLSRFSQLYLSEELEGL